MESGEDKLDPAQAEAVSNLVSAVDIEHVPVSDDPRKWSSARKNLVLLLISCGSMIAGFSANIQNPSIEDMERDLTATSSQISLSISLFIVIQGSAPLLWSAVSEIKGRRFVYLVSLSIYVVGSTVVALSRSIGLVIGFRVLQAAGSSAVMTLGAATLADVFDPKERGTKMGIYYMAPLVGPSLGPILGGIFTTAFNWRAPFWFLAILSGSFFLAFLFLFKDTYRSERSMIYQTILKKRLQEAALTVTQSAQPKASKAKPSSPFDSKECTNNNLVAALEVPQVKVSLKDVNPAKPIWQILQRVNNILILIASGLLFGFSFVIMYSTSRTLGTSYGYNALKIGLVLLSSGMGCIVGSVLGGRFSDYVLARLILKNRGIAYPEMRLRSTIHGLVLFPLFVIGYAWVCDRHLHVAALSVFLFITGALALWIYTSTLAYIVDSNSGRSSTVVAVNSCFRGIAGFIGAEITVPLQDKIGDGWMYTIIAGLMAVASILIFVVMKWGQKWRTIAEYKESEKLKRTTATSIPCQG